MDMMEFDGKTKEQLFESLSSTADGLTSDEAARRRKKHGPNQLVFHREKSPLIMLLEEFKGMFPMLLLVSAILCFFANKLSPGEGYNFIGLALLGVVVLNASVSFVQLEIHVCPQLYYWIILKTKMDTCIAFQVDISKSIPAHWG